MDGSQDSLSALITAVRAGAHEMERAARRLELAKKQGVAAAEKDLIVVARWLEHAARIAALSCNEPNPLSKELGARLEDRTTRLHDQLHKTS